METAVRYEKDTANLARAAGDDVLRPQCQGSVLDLQERYRRVAEGAGLDPNWKRMNVMGFRDAGENTAMARGDAVGHWPAGGVPISAKDYQDLKSYANERGIRLRSFENFDGDISLLKSVLMGCISWPGISQRSIPPIKVGYNW